MGKFRINSEINSTSDQDIRASNFSKGADTHSIDNSFDAGAKPNKQFMVILNDYEIEMIKKMSEKLERSQRYVGRMLILKALKSD